MEKYRFSAKVGIVNKKEHVGPDLLKPAAAEFLLLSLKSCWIYYRGCVLLVLWLKAVNRNILAAGLVAHVFVKISLLGGECLNESQKWELKGLWHRIYCKLHEEKNAVLKLGEFIFRRRRCYQSPQLVLCMDELWLCPKILGSSLTHFWWNKAEIHWNELLFLSSVHAASDSAESVTNKGVIVLG